MEYLLEACVESASAARAAEDGGADRVELCANLAEGGVTADPGEIASVGVDLRIPFVVLVRPRPGNFVYGAAEMEVCRRAVDLALEAGAEGVALGVLTEDGRLDVANTRELVNRARPMRVTFHRAFDETGDLDAAFEALRELGVDRVLTSGGAPSAQQGQDVLARLVARTDGVLDVVVAGTVRPENVRAIATATAARQLHFRTDGAERVRAVRRALAAEHG